MERSTEEVINDLPRTDGYCRFACMHIYILFYAEKLILLLVKTNYKNKIKPLNRAEMIRQPCSKKKKKICSFTFSLSLLLPFHFLPGFPSSFHHRHKKKQPKFGTSVKIQNNDNWKKKIITTLKQLFRSIYDIAPDLRGACDFSRVTDKQTTNIHTNKQTDDESI